MDLDERKSAILKALIEDYIENAEPVGSRTIAKKCPIGLSSATIRNEMSDLEEMGYLAQPHASAGRRPSSMAYRVYVDNLIENIKSTTMELDFLKMKMQENLLELNKLLDFAAKSVSETTGLTAITNIVSPNAGTINHFEIVRISEHYLMFILVTSTGAVKNRQVRILTAVDDESICYIKNIINEEFAGHRMADITPSKIERIKTRFNSNFELLGVILDFITECMEDKHNAQFHMEGKSYMLKAPEFSDTEKIADFLDLVDSKEKIGDLMDGMTEKAGTTVVIGDESPILKDKDLSMVVTSYEAGGGKMGVIGVIGPKRMNYSKVISTLENMSHMMGNLLGDSQSEKKGSVVRAVKKQSKKRE